MPARRNAGVRCPPTALPRPPRRPTHGRVRPAGRQTGASLVELLVAITLSMVLSGALLSLVWSFQQWSGRLQRTLERDENLRLAPLLLSRYLASAGSRRWEGNWRGVQVRGSTLEVRADVEGKDGFPDGRLDGGFERVALWQDGENLKLRSGRGSFQPLLMRVSSWTAERPHDQLLLLKVHARSRPVPGSAAADPDEEQEIAVHLPNYRPNLFREATR